MKWITTAVAVILAGSVAAAEPAERDMTEVTANCVSEWPDDYSMQKYCLDRNQEGYETASAYWSTSGEGTLNIIGPSFRFCEGKWGQQWEMVAYCMQSEVDGAKEASTLLKQTPEAVGIEIYAKCKMKWDDQFSMIGYCIDRQVSAWLAMNE